MDSKYGALTWYVLSRFLRRLVMVAAGFAVLVAIILAFGGVPSRIESFSRLDTDTLLVTTARGSSEWSRVTIEETSSSVLVEVRQYDVLPLGAAVDAAVVEVVVQLKAPLGNRRVFDRHHSPGPLQERCPPGAERCAILNRLNATRPGASVD